MYVQQQKQKFSEIVPPTFDEGTGGAITLANAGKNQCYTCLGLAVDTGEDYYAKDPYIDIGRCYNYNIRTYFYCIRNEFDCYVFD